MVKRFRLPARYMVLLLGVCCSLFSTSWSGNVASAQGVDSPAIDQVVQQVLVNIRTNGWNPLAQTHGQTVGGLYINWEMDNPANTNLGGAPTDHDPQVDLYYLTSLAEYKTLHPSDTSYTADLPHALAQVETDFNTYNVPKGWLYFYLLRDAVLLQNSTLLLDAYKLVGNFYTNWYDPTQGMVYNRYGTPAGAVIGDYSIEHTLECGAALIDAGKIWNNQVWLNAGISTINRTLSLAYNAQYNMFYASMSVLNNGTQQIENPQAKPTTEGQAVDALVDAYNLTQNTYYLQVAGTVLNAMFTSSLWDQANGGLFFALNMQTGQLQNSYKETRGQALALLGLLRYNETVNQRLAQPQILSYQGQVLTNLLTNNFYNATYHGYFYRVTPTFGIYTSSPGQGIGYEDDFTTEAMGIVMDALQQTEFSYMPF